MATKIQEYQFDKNFEKLASVVYAERDLAGENLVKTAKNINNENKAFTVAYYEAYLSYIELDSKIMKFNLDSLKAEYEAIKSEIKTTPVVDKAKKLKNLINNCEIAFNKYYSYYEAVLRCKEILANELEIYRESKRWVVDFRRLTQYFKVVKKDFLHLKPAQECYYNSTIVPIFVGVDKSLGREDIELEI